MRFVAFDVEAGGTSPDRHALTILALDPSTEVTGIAIVQFDISGKPCRHWAMAINASAQVRGTTLTARLERIRCTRQQIAAYLSTWPGGIDMVAYETDTERGHGSSEALKMAAGAYLSLSALAGLPVVPITRQAACVASGSLFVYRQPAGKTHAEREAKRRRLKAAVVAWANESSFDAGLSHDPEGEAIADALAVARACCDKEMARQRRARPLFGPGSRGGKT